MQWDGKGLSKRDGKAKVVINEAQRDDKGHDDETRDTPMLSIMNRICTKPTCN